MRIRYSFKIFQYLGAITMSCRKLEGNKHLLSYLENQTLKHQQYSKQITTITYFHQFTQSYIMKSSSTQSWASSLMPHVLFNGKSSGNPDPAHWYSLKIVQGMHQKPVPKSVFFEVLILCSTWYSPFPLGSEIVFLCWRHKNNINNNNKLISQFDCCFGMQNKIIKPFQSKF